MRVSTRVAAALAAAAALFVPGLRAQSTRIAIHSEFQRPDPFGGIVAADRAERPREILSPTVLRNAYASFLVAVTTQPKGSYFLGVQTIPPGIAKWTIHEAHFAEIAGSWIPESLYEARYPYFGVMPNPDQNIARQSTRVYVLDLWIPPDIPDDAFRLEFLTKVGYWRIAPMEIRVLPVTAADLPPAGRPTVLPAPDEPADTAARLALDAWLTDEALPARGPLENVRSLILRNVLQDLAVARSLESRLGREKLTAEIRSLMPPPDSRPPSGAEWYLRVRDYLYREASK